MRSLHLRFFLLFLSLPGCLAVKGELKLGVVCYQRPANINNFIMRLDLLTTAQSMGTLEFGSENEISKHCSSPSTLSKLLNVSVSTDQHEIEVRIDIKVDKRGQASYDRATVSPLPELEALPNAMENGSDFQSHLSFITFTSLNSRQLGLALQFRCAENYYGPLCAIKCVPNERYTCQPSGARSCLAGWSGPTCNRRNRCRDLVSPCKAWANCLNTRSGSFCVCDGRIGEQCQTGVDPCLNHLCTANESCVSVNDRPTCVQPWTLKSKSKIADNSPSAQAVPVRGAGAGWVSFIIAIPASLIVVAVVGGIAIASWRHFHHHRHSSRNP